jgi:N-acyl-D-amino-acid deacylase
MPSPYDLVVRNGTVVDGTGGAPFEGDIAIADGRIAAIGKIDGRGKDEIDAKGLLVTPGFVDIHTHYDGQVIWSDRLSPSSSHGVTSVVMGNCGVGFAPCRAKDRELLISVMEGVEDIPGVVMAEGLSWDWESFPEYLKTAESRAHDIDFATQIPHSALRVYVMGERGANREPATEDDLNAMQRLVREALGQGALGFATSRIFIHRTRTGAHIPSYEAAEAELSAIAGILKEENRGVLQFVLGSPPYDLLRDVHLVTRLANASGRPASFSMNADPGTWRVLEHVAQVNRQGGRVRAQIYPRPIGLIIGHELSVNPFCLCPSYQPLLNMPFKARIAALRDPSMRQRLLAEQPSDAVAPLAIFGRTFERMFPLGDPPDYEPPPETSVAAQARAHGVKPEELAYDLLLEDDGKAMLYVAIANYSAGNLETFREMIESGEAVLGLGDGGAHYGMICDSSYPSFVLAHWTRDRAGKRLSLPDAVKHLSDEPAATVGLRDRGRIARGMKADLNLIDYDAIGLERPTVAYDLPAGGKRLMQAAKGIRATIVAGQIIQRDGEPTGALPGKLVRGQQAAPV